MSEWNTSTHDPEELHLIGVEKLREAIRLQHRRDHQNVHLNVPFVPRAQDVSPELSAKLTSPHLLQRHLKAARIKLTARKMEVELLGKKWFDYRFMHPVDATQLFADEFARILQEVWKKYRDRDEARWKRAFCGTSLFDNDPATISGTWSARQKADELGMPYSFFIREGVEFCQNSGYQRFARPNQLLSPRVVAEISKHWVGSAARDQISEAPQYLARNWKGHPLQEAHIRALVQKPGNSHFLNISGLVFQRELISVERAAAEFGEDAVKEGRDFWEKSKDELGSLLPAADETPVDLHPGCFGVPGAFNTAPTICISCPFRAECQAEHETMQAILVGVYGSSDPHADNKRKKAADRQRRLRQKKSKKTI